MGDLGVWEILIIAFVVVLLFGSKKLPDAARSFGRSLRIFKAETKGLREDDAAKAAQDEQAGAPAAPPRQIENAPVTVQPVTVQPVNGQQVSGQPADADQR
jgi:sec-independent protein translocase protein TatA